MDGLVAELSELSRVSDEELRSLEQLIADAGA
jgi:hypothetical protein